MKNVFKRFSYILLSCYMVFYPVASASIQVQAFEWVEPSLSFAESLGYLLSLLGIAYVGDKAANWEGWNDSGVSSDYADEFQQYAIEHGLTYQETTSWMDEVGNGRLNQASQVWEKFKAWASSLVNKTSIPSGLSVSEYIYKLNPSIDTSSITDLNSYSYAYYYYSSSNIITLVCFNASSYSFNSSNTQIIFDRKRLWRFVSFNASGSGSVALGGQESSVISLNPSSYDYYFFNVIFPDISSFHIWEISDNNSLFVSISPQSIEDLSLALQTAISDAIPDVIPLPWDNVGDNTQAINDKMDELLEKVALGVLTIPAFMEAVQTLLGVFTVDTTADGVLIPERPNPDTPDEPQKLEDEAEKNKSNSGFMLGGLEKVFPFCIPFDLYAFMTLLVAEPVAPVIEYPIYNPVTDNNEIITIDFSTWESVVVIFRYIFDFLFIIGLLLIARALIGEGSDA